MSDQEEKDQHLDWDILSTDYRNVDFEEYRKTHDKTWLNKDRQILWIGDMETDHIIRSVNMLERAGQEYTKAYSGLIEELKKRGHDGIRLE